MMVCVAMFGMAAPVFAEGNPGAHGHKGKGVEKRIQNQKRRIQQGVEKGKLTADQAKTLESNVDKIQAEKDAATANGQKLTKEERTKLQQELKDSSKSIHDLKNPPKPAQPATPAVPAVPSSN
jgi:chromosome segregation ATPase